MMMKLKNNVWNFHSPRKTIGRTRSGPRNSKAGPKMNLFAFLIRGFVLLAFVYAFVAFQFQSPSITTGSTGHDGPLLLPIRGVPKTRHDYCDFRKYPPRRYYGLSEDKDSLPDFLGKAEYIYGQLPQIIHPSQHRSKQKLCVDQSEWHWKEESRLPFADGTNPSILKLADNPRIDGSLRQLLGPNAHYLATICMTDSQCSWNDSPQEELDYNLSQRRKPTTVHTVLLIMNENFETLHEETIMSIVDAQWGLRVRAPKKDSHGSYSMKVYPLDDARLFTVQGQVWLSYREGRLFGYDKQVLNRLHFEILPSTGSLLVSLKASETETLCCGRNMALIDNVHTGRLQALTWVDPVKVVDVEFTNAYNRAGINKQLETTRRLSSIEQGAPDVRTVQGKAPPSESALTSIGLNATSGGVDEGVSSLGTSRRQDQRRLLAVDKSSPNPSHFHGTNGFMVYLPHAGEYLGVGHFHRPPGREPNDYARFGHHYTHAFFTISDAPPFQLKRLSPELVLPSHANPNDAEIIQFWSGLELMDDNTLALAYGINDCEGAATYLELAVVEDLLRDVPEGQEVVDLMKPLE